MVIIWSLPLPEDREQEIPVRIIPYIALSRVMLNSSIFSLSFVHEEINSVSVAGSSLKNKVPFSYFI